MSPHHVDEQLILEAVEIPFGLQVCLLLISRLEPLLEMPYLLLLPIQHPFERSALLFWHGEFMCICDTSNGFHARIGSL